MRRLDGVREAFGGCAGVVLGLCWGCIGGAEMKLLYETFIFFEISMLCDGDFFFYARPEIDDCAGRAFSPRLFIFSRGRF